MRYFKITLPKSKGGELIYPPNYQDEVGDMAIDHLYWDEDYQTYLLLVIPDKSAENIVREGIEEISELDAKAISDANEVKTETIVDEVKLRRLELKAALNIALTPEETDAIDINQPTSIFKTKKILSDRIDDFTALEATATVDPIK